MFLGWLILHCQDYQCSFRKSPRLLIFQMMNCKVHLKPCTVMRELYSISFGYCKNICLVCQWCLQHNATNVLFTSLYFSTSVSWHVVHHYLEVREMPFLGNLLGSGWWKWTLSSKVSAIMLYQKSPSSQVMLIRWENLR